MKPTMTELFASLCVVDDLFTAARYEPHSTEHGPGNDTSTMTAVRYFAEINEEEEGVVSVPVKAGLYAVGLLAAALARGGLGDHHYLAMARELRDTAQRIVDDIQKDQDDAARRLNELTAKANKPAN